MQFKLIQKLKKYLWPYSLRNRLFVILILSSLIPLILIGSVSYYSIYNIQENKVSSGIQNNLKQLEIEFENIIKNLNYTSQQFAFEGGVGRDVEKVLNANNPYEKANLMELVDKQLKLISYTNPQLGLMFYYIPNSEGKFLFETIAVKESVEFDKLPIIAKERGITYYSPHESLYRFGNDTVLSVLREVNIQNEDKVYIYVESNYKLFKNVIEEKHYSGMNTLYLMTDKDGSVIYSENPEEISIGTVIKQNDTNRLYNKFKDYYMFKESNEQGWNMMVAVSSKSFKNEINRWVIKYIFYAAISICISLFFAWIVWRTIYKPIRILNKKIDLMNDGKFDASLKSTDIKEFDDLISKFRNMSERIKSLLLDIERKEKLKRQLEIDKLLYQINPHFLNNTLDTVIWMARINGQDEIDNLVSSLNRVLHYNLGKQGLISTVRAEIESLKDYTAIQKARYDREFEIIIKCNPEVMEVEIPRFILQPLVENSFYHGIRDNGEILISIDYYNKQYIVAEVRDNGKGMTKENVESLLGSKTDNQNHGMGIGINYVKGVLEAYYGNQVKFNIESELGKGTRIVIIMPIKIIKSGLSLT